MHPLLIFHGPSLYSLSLYCSAVAAEWRLGKGDDPSQPFLPFFFLLSSLICCLSLHRDSQAGPCRAACYTYCPAGIHCSQLVCRHVFDSTRTCVRTNQLAHFCKRAGVSGCKCLQKHFFFSFFFWGGGGRKMTTK